MFVLVVGKINLVFKNPVSKGAANICLTDSVLKGRFAELDITVQHTLFYHELDWRRNDDSHQNSLVYPQTYPRYT